METALTYLPLAEAASELVAELDVLLGFATAASLAPHEYVRPTMHEADSGVIRLQVSRPRLHHSSNMLANDIFTPGRARGIHAWS